jgi:hypothetical protein
MNLPLEIYKLNGKPVKVKLIRSFYGLKQTGKLWNSSLSSKLPAAGLFDYVKHDIEINAKTFVVTYVDDIIITGNSPDKIRKTIDYFATEFKKISDLGEINHFIGVDLMRDRAKRSITLSQSPYASHIRAKHFKSDEIIGSKKPRKDLTVRMKPTFDINAKGDGSNQPIHEEIGQFRYLADHIKLDLLASVSLMGNCTANPHDEHVKGVRTFAEYIATSHDIGLTLGGEPEVDYSDSVMPRISRKVIVS